MKSGSGLISYTVSLYLIWRLRLWLCLLLCPSHSSMPVNVAKATAIATWHRFRFMSQMVTHQQQIILYKLFKCGYQFIAWRHTCRLTTSNHKPHFNTLHISWHHVHMKEEHPKVTIAIEPKVNCLWLGWLHRKAENYQHVSRKSNIVPLPKQDTVKCQRVTVSVKCHLVPLPKYFLNCTIPTWRSYHTFYMKV